MGNLCNITRIHTVPYQTGSPHAESYMAQNATLVLWSHRRRFFLLRWSFPVSTLSSESSFPDFHIFHAFGAGDAESRPDTVPCYPSFFSPRSPSEPLSSTSELLSPARGPVARSNEFSDFSRFSAMSVHMRRKKKKDNMIHNLFLQTNLVNNSLNCLRHAPLYVVCSIV